MKPNCHTIFLWFVAGYLNELKPHISNPHYACCHKKMFIDWLYTCRFYTNVCVFLVHTCFPRKLTRCMWVIIDCRRTRLICATVTHISHGRTKSVTQCLLIPRRILYNHVYGLLAQTLFSWLTILVYQKLWAIFFRSSSSVSVINEDVYVSYDIDEFFDPCSSLWIKLYNYNMQG